MLKNETLKNGTFRIGLYGSAPCPGMCKTPNEVGDGCLLLKNRYEKLQADFSQINAKKLNRLAPKNWFLI